MESSNASSSSASVCNAGIVALPASQPTLANVGDPTTNVGAVARVEVAVL
jgi:3-polyprenyl-4-hydroxybenzoate decarboxylase